MPPAHLSQSAKPLSGRYLSFEEREEIALLRAQGRGIRHIACRLERAPQTRRKERQDREPCPKPDLKLEAAVKLLREGNSQKAAAKSVSISAARLRRFTYYYKIAARIGRKWVFTDERPRRVPTLTQGQVKTITVPGFEEASKAGSYWNDMGRFLRTNEHEILLPYTEDGLIDREGRFFPFETDPNELHRIAAMDTPPFHEIYQIISTN